MESHEKPLALLIPPSELLFNLPRPCTAYVNEANNYEK